MEAKSSLVVDNMARYVDDYWFIFYLLEINIS